MSITYDVRRSLAAQDDWTVVATDLTEIQYLDMMLEAETGYDYQVRACDGAECSDWSPAANATTLETPAVTYDVRRSLAGQDDWTIIATNLGVTQYLDTGLESNTAYDYQVRACTQQGCSDWSDIASDTTDPEFAPMQADLFGEGYLDAELVAVPILFAALYGEGYLEAGLLARPPLEADLFGAGFLEFLGGAELETDLFGSGYLDAEFPPPPELLADLFGAGFFWDSYTGPGTGLQAIGPKRLTSLIHEGDTFILDRSTGGLHGEAGLARVLSLALDDDDAVNWQVQMIPFTDHALAVLLDELGRPRYTVELSGNLFRQLRELQRRN